VGVDNTSITLLQILSPGRLDCHGRLGSEAAVDVGMLSLGRAGVVVLLSAAHCGWLQWFERVMVRMEDNVRMVAKRSETNFYPIEMRRGRQIRICAKMSAAIQAKRCGMRWTDEGGGHVFMVFQLRLPKHRV
jgi:hypothetical protein